MFWNALGTNEIFPGIKKCRQMIKYTYLLIDVLSISVPLVFSFHPRIRLYRHWNALLPAMLIVAAGYALWDSVFVHFGIWGFNSHYITGLYIGNLPIEELLFFICIPYACVFTFECFSGLIGPAFSGINRINSISYVFSALMILIAVLFHTRAYTASSLTLIAGLVLLGTLIKIPWLPKFYMVYGILLTPFLVVNGLLTGTGLAAPVVWYSGTGIIGLRIMTIPVEDIFYGMGLILLNVWLYTFIRKSQWKHKRIFTQTHF
jgi:lycopene cyclase domain-containing protein